MFIKNEKIGYIGLKFFPGNVFGMCLQKKSGSHFSGKIIRKMLSTFFEVFGNLLIEMKHKVIFEALSVDTSRKFRKNTRLQITIVIFGFYNRFKPYLT